MPSSRSLEGTWVVVLLALFAALAATSIRDQAPTFDETAHLAAGISYVQTGDYRMNPEHPALPKRLAGAAATAAGARAAIDTEAWRTGEQWDFAWETLYGSGTDWRRILFAGRLPGVAIGVLLGALLWGWARAMIGGAGAALALALYALSPNFLAHAPLVTTDVPLTFTVVGTAACLWAAWRSGRFGWTVAAAAFVGLSMATKFSAFSYGPVWALLAVVPSAARPWRRGLAHLAVLLVGSVVFTMLFVSASYGFAFEGVTIRSLGMAGRGITPEDMGWLRRAPYEILARVPWPAESFAEGMKEILLYVEAGHPVYLLGRRAEAGWWWSSFVALGAKLPLTLLGLTIAAAYLTIRGRVRRSADLVFLLAPAAIVLFTNVVAKLGIGVRHLLPMVPFLMLFAAWPLRGGGFRYGLGSMAVIVALLLGQLVGTARAYPHYIAYFNVAVGGPRGGYRLLGDSNLDWGQDLSRAASRLKARGVTGAILCYFGTADPFVEGIDWQLLPPTRRARSRDPWKVLPPEGPLWLAMSATNRQGIYYRGPGGRDEKPYPWLDGVEPQEVVGGSIFLYDITHEAAVQKGMKEIYRRHGMVDEAEALMKRMLERWPYDHGNRNELFDFYMARGDEDAAEKTLLDCPNGEAEDVLRVAEIRKHRYDHQSVLDAYEAGVRAFSSSHELRNAFAWYLQETQTSLDRALGLADEALHWVPDDPYYLDTKGMVLRARGEPDEAVAVFDDALAQPGGDLPDIRWHRALALLAAGRSEEGMAAAREVRVREDLGQELQEEIEAWFYEVGE